MPFAPRSIARLLPGALCRALLVLLALIAARTAEAGASERLRIAVAEFPPYAVRAQDGSWHGRAVELFAATAKDIGVEVEFVETPVPLILRSIDNGALDGTVLPTVETLATLGIVSLTHDWSISELHIATSEGATLGEEIDVLLHSLFGRQQWKIYSAIAVAVMAFAIAMWLLEKRSNRIFEGRRGLGSGMWWSIATLTTVGYGDAVPRTPLGRFAAGGWMLISLVLIALFTATVTSALTKAGVAIEVNGPSDLPIARVGIVEDGTAEAYFGDHYLPHVSFPSVGDAMRELASGALDAVVADKDVLADAILAERRANPGGRTIGVLPAAIDRRGIAFGLRRSLPADFIRRFDQALVARIGAGAA